MNIAYRKTGFKRELLRFLMYKYFSICIVSKKTITTYLKATHTRISSFKYVFIVFSRKKTDATILGYTFFFNRFKNLYE